MSDIAGARVAVRNAIRLVDWDPFTVGDVLKALHTAHDHVQVRRIVEELIDTGEIVRSDVATPKRGTAHYFSRTPAFRADVYGTEEQLRTGKLVQDIAFAWGHQRCQRFKDEHAD